MLKVMSLKIKFIENNDFTCDNLLFSGKSSSSCRHPSLSSISPGRSSRIHPVHPSTSTQKFSIPYRETSITLSGFYQYPKILNPLSRDFHNQKFSIPSQRNSHKNLFDTNLSFQTLHLTTDPKAHVYRLDNISRQSIIAQMPIIEHKPEKEISIKSLRVRLAFTRNNKISFIKIFCPL